MYEGQKENFTKKENVKKKFEAENFKMMAK